MLIENISLHIGSVPIFFFWTWRNDASDENENAEEKKGGGDRIES